jgi:transcriptional regulator with XRE-family HTH domain
VPKKGHQFPIDAAWQGRVRAGIRKLGISQNEFATRCGMRKSSMSAALRSGAIQTAFMPEIHRELGWDPPPRALPPHQLEALDLLDRLPEIAQGRYVERLRAEVEAYGEDTKRGKR